MTLVKIWVMICEPHCDTRTETFTGATIEDCVNNLQNYLEFKTAPGTRTTIVQSGYIEEAVTDGI
jgi:hypothetical protein